MDLSDSRRYMFRGFAYAQSPTGRSRSRHQVERERAMMTRRIALHPPHLHHRVPLVTVNLLMRRDRDANVTRSFVRSCHTYHTCFREAIAFTSVTFRRRRVDPSHFRALATMSSFIDPVSDPSTMISRDARRSEKRKKEKRAARRLWSSSKTDLLTR